MVIRDRRHLSEDGIVLPIIAINRHTGRMENLPEIVSRGFAVAEDGEATDYEHMRHMAGEALSEAKISGRNCCIVKPVNRPPFEQAG